MIHIPIQYYLLDEINKKYIEIDKNNYNELVHVDKTYTIICVGDIITALYLKKPIDIPYPTPIGICIKKIN